jgi:hypothetical protein
VGPAQATDAGTQGHPPRGRCRGGGADCRRTSNRAISVRETPGFASPPRDGFALFSINALRVCACGPGRADPGQRPRDDRTIGAATHPGNGTFVPIVAPAPLGVGRRPRPGRCMHPGGSGRSALSRKHPLLCRPHGRGSNGECDCPSAQRSKAVNRAFGKGCPQSAVSGRRMPGNWVPGVSTWQGVGEAARSADASELGVRRVATARAAHLAQHSLCCYAALTSHSRAAHRLRNSRRCRCAGCLENDHQPVGVGACLGSIVTCSPSCSKRRTSRRCTTARARSSK